MKHLFSLPVGHNHNMFWVIILNYSVILYEKLLYCVNINATCCLQTSYRLYTVLSQYVSLTKTLHEILPNCVSSSIDHIHQTFYSALHVISLPAFEVPAWLLEISPWGNGFYALFDMYT